MRISFFCHFFGFIYCLLTASISAEQGYYIEEQVTTPPIFGLPKQTHVTKTWITKSQLRRDEGDKHQTLLIDTQQDQAWLLQHYDSTLMKMDMATFQGLALMSMMMFGVTYDTLTGDPVIPDSIFYQTGRKSRIGDWNCKEVIVQRRQPNPARKGNQPVVMWVTTNSTSNQSLYASILKAMMGPMAKQYASFFNQLERLGGYPAELHTRAMGMEITQKLQILEARDIPESMFIVPSGYRLNDQ
ncbi:hypothetical protein ACFL4L_07910 [bacterium]